MIKTTMDRRLLTRAEKILQLSRVRPTDAKADDAHATHKRPPWNFSTKTHEPSAKALAQASVRPVDRQPLTAPIPAPRTSRINAITRLPAATAGDLGINPIILAPVPAPRIRRANATVSLPTATSLHSATNDAVTVTTAAHGTHHTNNVMTVASIATHAPTAASSEPGQAGTGDLEIRALTAVLPVEGGDTATASIVCGDMLEPLTAVTDDSTISETQPSQMKNKYSE
jgi:hypothetical protein